MRYLCACLAALLVAPVAVADGASLKDARQRLLRGNYAEAREQFTELLKEPKHQAAAAVGLARALQAEGAYDKALAALDAALKDQPKSADLHAARAELLSIRGRWDDAQEAAREALRLARDANFPAHWILARLYRDRGLFDKANTELVWFVRAYNKRIDDGQDVVDPDELLLIGLASAERARWDSRLSDQFKDVLADLWGVAAKNDKDFWPAHYHSGRLYLEKYNKAGALRAFDKALTINPRAAEALLGKGLLALQSYELKSAEDFAKRALEINPRLPEALRLLADIQFMAGDLKETLGLLEKARAVNPREEPTLARIAACLHLQRKDAEFKAVVAEVEKHNPKPGLFYAELGERFEERKLYDPAEKYYKQAIKLRPNLAAPRNHLGLLYMRMGKEEAARPILENAAEVDEFNIRVYNSLKVLNHLDGYQTLDTDHFQLRHDPKNDKVLAAFMAKYLEDIHRELAELFQYKPKGQILIEVFNKHEMFSGRVVAVPDLRTIGACTGRLVAMVSPRDTSGVIPKPFNWVRVLRHELVHVFNLEQTKFQVPHWFTEGLAVSLEGFPMPPSWHQLLKRRIASGELMNLDNIQLGFVRPGSGEEWQLAYLQSHLYVEYLKKTHGKQVVGQFLKAYADGLDTDAALRQICKVSKEQFEKDYRKHLEAFVQKIHAGRPAEKALSLNELRAAHAKAPNNPDLAAKLAERYVITGETKEARKLIDAALAKKAGHPLASYVLAQLLLGEGQAAQAIGILEPASDIEPRDPRVLRLLGKLQFEAKKFDDAARTYELGRKAEPYEDTWLVELAKVYGQTKDDEKLIGVLKDLAPKDADALEVRRKLAQLLSQAGRHAEAERYARQALEIDVLDRDAQRILLAALEAQNKTNELKQVRKMLGE